MFSGDAELAIPWNELTKFLLGDSLNEVIFVSYNFEHVSQVEVFIKTLQQIRQHNNLAASCVLVCNFKNMQQLES